MRTFRDFMESALYDPERGFYSTRTQTADFYTAPELHQRASTWFEHHGETAQVFQTTQKKKRGPKAGKMEKRGKGKRIVVFNCSMASVLRGVAVVLVLPRGPFP